MSEETSKKTKFNNVNLSLSIDTGTIEESLEEVFLQLKGLIRNTTQIEEKVDEIMTDRAALNAALSALNSALISETQEIKDAQAAMQKKIDELSVPADFSEEIARINQAVSNISDLAPTAPSAPITPVIVEEVITAPPEPVTEESPAITNETITTEATPTLTEEPVASPS